MNRREYTIQLTVSTDITTEEKDVVECINAALDESGNNDWGDWIVGSAAVTGMQLIEEDDEEEDDE